MFYVSSFPSRGRERRSITALRGMCRSVGRRLPSLGGVGWFRAGETVRVNGTWVRERWERAVGAGICRGCAGKRGARLRELHRTQLRAERGARYSVLQRLSLSLSLSFTTRRRLSSPWPPPSPQPWIPACDRGRGWWVCPCARMCFEPVRHPSTHVFVYVCERAVSETCVRACVRLVWPPSGGNTSHPISHPAIIPPVAPIQCYP